MCKRNKNNTKSTVTNETSVRFFYHYYFPNLKELFFVKNHITLLCVGLDPGDNRFWLSSPARVRMEPDLFCHCKSACKGEPIVCRKLDARTGKSDDPLSGCVCVCVCTHVPHGVYMRTFVYQYLSVPVVY